MTSSPSTIPDTSASPARRARSGWLTVILVAVTLAAFCRLITSEFSWWDDGVTLHHNPRFNPPTLETLQFYWTQPEAGLYVPVTQTIWAALARMAYVGFPDDLSIQLNPGVFHATSVLLHLTSSILVLQLLRRLVGTGWPALAGALLFALHPVQVETVGWISGMKDLLCWCFSLAALLLYVRRAQASDSDRPMWAGVELPLGLVLLALAMLSKPTAMVMPAAMLAIDGLLIRRRWRRAIVELLPFIAVAAADAVLARRAQYVFFLTPMPLWQRPFIAGDALAFYIRKILWPATLGFDYGRQPERVMASHLGYIWWLLPAAVGVLALGLALRRGWRVPLAAITLFVIGVGPVLGLATFQMQSYSTVTDHYLYFSMLGPAMLLAWILSRWSARELRACAAIALAALGVRTFLQSAVWHDTFILFNHEMEVNPRSFVAAGNLAAVYLTQVPHRPDLAEPLIDRAYALAPDNFFVLSNYADVKVNLGKKTEAFATWEACRLLLRASAPVGSMRAKFAGEVAQHMLDLGEYDQAATWLDEAVDARSDDPRALTAISIVRRALAAHSATTRAAATRPTTTTAPVHPPASVPTRASGPN